MTDRFAILIVLNLQRWKTWNRSRGNNPLTQNKTVKSKSNFFFAVQKKKLN